MFTRIKGGGCCFGAVFQVVVMRERGYSAEVCSSGVDFFMKVRSTAHTLYLSDGNTESAKCCVVVWGFFYSLKDDEEDKHVKGPFKIFLNPVTQVVICVLEPLASRTGSEVNGFKRLRLSQQC